MNNTKETVKIVILLILVIFFALVVSNTKGDDELKWDINLDFSSEDEFSYPIAESEYNGEYKNTASNGMYVMVGMNPDGTYRVYFVKDSVRNIVLKLDSAQMKDGKITYTDVTNVSAPNTQMVMEFRKNEIDIEPATLGITNEQMKGYYLKMKDLKVFSMSEFEYAR
ncbi:MAG: hypothetical protein J6C46_09805 [Clostridia bacterium]|nr:hypothetical protein [Clostridia bacterium]